MRSHQKPNEKTRLSVYFQVHQPRRLRPFGFFDIGKDKPVFDDDSNREIIRRVARNCYLPANEMLLQLIRLYPQLRITFSVSGTALEQFEKYEPEVIASFRALAETGSVEFLGETYYHSLASVSDSRRFLREVKQHRRAMEKHFGIAPVIFRNTELIYSDEVGRLVSTLGFHGIYVDGIQRILRHRSADHLYEHPDKNGLKIFLRNFSLSDDIAFRFSNRHWKEWPLSPEKFVRWLTPNQVPDRLINLGLDYETFGEHQKSSTGIFKFMKDAMTAIAKSRTIQMVSPSEAIRIVKTAGTVSSPDFISWADKERDLSAWLGNDLQRDAFDTLNSLGQEIQSAGDESLTTWWNYLQTSDHFYYMSTKKGDDGMIHNYFSPYSSPYEAFINYMNVLSHLVLRLENRKKAMLRVPEKPEPHMAA